MSCTRMRSPESVMDDQGNIFKGANLHASYDVGGQPWHLVSDGAGPRILRPNMIDAGIYVTASENIPEQIEKDFNEGPEAIDFDGPAAEKQPDDGDATGGGHPAENGDGDPSTQTTTGDDDGTGSTETGDGKAESTEGASA